METIKSPYKGNCMKCKNYNWRTCSLPNFVDNPQTDKCGQFLYCKKCEGKTVGTAKSLDYYSKNCAYYKEYITKIWDNYAKSHTRMTKAQIALVQHYYNLKVNIDNFVGNI